MSFDWRHKMLASLSSLVPPKLLGTVECDELELSVSNKGDKNRIVRMCNNWIIRLWGLSII